MDIIGLIVEYNPFHNGHLHHLQEVDKKFEDNLKIAVMSGDFVQRGEPSIIDRFSKAKIALNSGIDILVELPSFYSCQSAEIFSKGAVSILERLNCSHIVFGTENNDINKLKSLLKIENEDNFKRILKDNLSKGHSYPSSYYNALKENLSVPFDNLKSNEILALEYLKALQISSSKITPISIERVGTDYYSENSELGISSASSIRENIKKNQRDSLNNYMPIDSFSEFIDKKHVFLEDYYELIRYEIINNRENLKNIMDMEIGLENRLYKMAFKYDDFSLFFDSIISKRITIGRTQRILIHILIGLTKDISNYVKQNTPYVRILGFSKKGQEYLNKLKKEEDYKERKILTSFKNIKELLTEKELEMLEFNERASLIYSFINKYDNIKLPLTYF